MLLPASPAKWALHGFLQSQAFAQQAVWGPNELTMTLTLDFQDKIFLQSHMSEEWESQLTLDVTSFLTVNLDFQGQILKYLYLRNRTGCGWVLLAFLRWTPPSTMWAGSLIFYGHRWECLNSPTFSNLGYVLHVEHISRVITIVANNSESPILLSQ